MIKVSFLSSLPALIANTGPAHQLRDVFAPLPYRVKLHFVATLVVVWPCFRLAIAIGHMDFADQAFLARRQGEE